MTDRISHLTVALSTDIRTDDAEQLIAAISMLRGVLKVQAHVAEPSEWTAQERARREMADKMWGIIYPKAI